MSFEIFFEKRAEKFLEKSEKLDSKRIFGQKELVFRIRIGDFRVLYRIDNEKNKIIIIDINKQSKIYK